MLFIVIIAMIVLIAGLVLLRRWYVSDDEQAFKEPSSDEVLGPYRRW